jgi:hypothetical protein
MSTPPISLSTNLLSVTHQFLLAASELLEEAIERFDGYRVPWLYSWEGWRRHHTGLGSL